eukprot:7379483-Prymnesium_polylepis.1
MSQRWHSTMKRATTSQKTSLSSVMKSASWLLATERIGSTTVQLHRGPQLINLLGKHRPRFVHFCGHTIPGDDGRSTLLLVDDRGLYCKPKIEDLVRICQACPTLLLCQLNGCFTEPLGKALAEHGVPTLVWSTLLLDGAASLFAISFWQSVHTQVVFDETYDSCPAPWRHIAFQVLTHMLSTPRMFSTPHIRAPR